MELHPLWVKLLLIGLIHCTRTEKPKLQLTSSLTGHVLTGNSVTLTCRLRTQSAGWKFYWITPTISTETETETFSYTISTVSDGGLYWCRAGRGNPVYYTDYSNTLQINVIESPKATLTIKPDTQVFIGETVTFSCIIQEGEDTEWTYDFLTDNKEFSQLYRTQEFITSSVTDSGKYTCRGRRKSDSQISKMSDPVSLTVSEKPKLQLTSSLTGDVLTGNSVTLTCRLRTQSAGWKFYWNKSTISTETETETFSYTISTVSDGGLYWCRAGRGNPVYYTDYSNALRINVIESPKPTLTIKPDTQVFRGEKVTFSCIIQEGEDTEWTYDLFRDNKEFSQLYRTQEFITSSITYSSKYNCRGRRKSDSQISKMSDPVSLTVSEKPELQLTSSLTGDVLTGNSVTLTCRLRPQSAGWKFYWNKPTINTETETETFSYTISTVYDGGWYGCRAGRGNPVYYTDYSDALQINVIESPKATLTIKPDTQVFRGEKVTFSCIIQEGEDTEWIYDLFRDNKEFSQLYRTQEFITSSVTYSSKYNCRGRRKSDSQISKMSDPVSLTVSDKPKPIVNVNPQSTVYTGDTVTLSCDLQSTRWTFYFWYQNQKSNRIILRPSNIKEFTVKVSNEGQMNYFCKARRGNYNSWFSDPVTITVKARPKPVVKVQEADHVFVGETVTFSCEIQTGGFWKYQWFKDNKELSDALGKKTYTITDVKESSKGSYTCSGTQSSAPKYTETSDAVTLNVSEKTKPEITADLKGAARAGTSVTLTCKLKLQSAGWKFYWIKSAQRTDTETETHHFFISSASVSDGGQYRCRAGRGNPVYYTDYSDALWVNVNGESPPVSLIINPSRTQHFTTDSLSLSCEDQSDSTGWTVRGYTHSEALFNCSSFSGSTCNIGSLSTSHTGVYWCQSESGGRSDSVNITVHDAVVILDSPVQPVTEGHGLILRCLNRSMLPETSVDFYKNNSVLQSQTTGEMTISRVLKSDEGFYHCKHPQKGESLKSWVSVRVLASGPTVVIIGLSLTSVFVILLILVILILRCRKKKGAQSQSPTVNQDTDQPTVDSATGSSSIICSQVMTRRKKHNDDAAQGPHDVLYSQIEMKNVKLQRKDDSPLRPSDVVYVTIKSKNKKPKDDDAEPSDMNYAEINLNKPQRKQEKSSVGAETVYSALKQNTDEGNFTAAADATYAQVRMKGKKDNAEDIAKIADVTYAQVKRKGKRDIAGPW